MATMPNRPDNTRQPNQKPYQKPNLIKGPLLTKVTAQPVVSGTAPCWIARAAFGEGDIRWLIFRAWLFEDAPAWFRRFYLCFGEAIGAWVGRHESARSMTRALMLPAVKRKVRS